MRHRRTPVHAAALALAFALAACSGGAAPMPGTLVASTEATAGGSDPRPTPRPPTSTIGERMAYEVSLHGVVLADLGIDIGGPERLGDHDTQVISIAVDTRTLASLLSPVHDRFTSWVDVVTGVPVQFHAQEAASKDDQVREETAARFAPGRYPVRLIRGDSAGVEEEQVVEGAPFDFASFLMYLRGWEAPIGSRLAIDIMRSRFVWRVQLAVAAHGNLVTALGELPVVRIEGEGVRLLRDGTVDPTSDRRRFSIWITDDSDRVPVKLAGHTDYGDVLLLLEAYTPGAAR